MSLLCLQKLVFPAVWSSSTIYSSAKDMMPYTFEKQNKMAYMVSTNMYSIIGGELSNPSKAFIHLARSTNLVLSGQDNHNTTQDNATQRNTTPQDKTTQHNTRQHNNTTQDKKRQDSTRPELDKETQYKTTQHNTSTTRQRHDTTIQHKTRTTQNPTQNTTAVAWAQHKTKQENIIITTQHNSNIIKQNNNATQIVLCCVVGSRCEFLLCCVVLCCVHTAGAECEHHTTQRNPTLHSTRRTFITSNRPNRTMMPHDDVVVHK
jgi:hypothetical protein